MRTSERLLACAAAVVLAAPAIGQQAPGVSAEQFAAAKKVWIAASLVVLGRSGSDYEVNMYVQSFAKEDAAHSIQNGTFNYLTAFAELKKRYLNASFGVQPISNAFIDTYGRDAYPDEVSGWMPKVAAQQAWYAIIFDAERKRMFADSFAHREMLERAYVTAFGRTDTDADRAYWMPRDGTFKEIVESARGYIYARPAEIDALVSRVLHSRYVNVTSNDTAQFRAKAVQGHLLYTELREELFKR